MEKTTTQELLAQAEKICAQRNVRLTPQRLEVLRLMSLQDGAISAYDLLDLLREAEPQAIRRERSVLCSTASGVFRLWVRSVSVVRYLS